MSALVDEATVTPLGHARECAAHGCHEDSIGAAKNGRRGRGFDAYCPKHKQARIDEMVGKRIRANRLRVIETDGAGRFERRARQLEEIGRDLDIALLAEAEAAAYADEQRRRWRNALIVLSREAGVA